MDRRGFLKLFGGVAAAAAAAPMIPFNRVWSFPSKIVIPDSGALGRAFGFDWSDEVTVGSLIQIRYPQQFIVRDDCYFREHDQLTEILKVGDIFTLASVNSINPPRR